jgi:hypothetical protein
MTLDVCAARRIEEYRSFLSQKAQLAPVSGPAPERSPHPAGLSPSRQHDDVTFVMERVRGALETPGELFDQHGAIHDMQYHGGRGADDAAASCHEAGWSMRDAARHLADALAVRAR